MAGLDLQRTKVRNRIKLLLTGNTSALANVYTSRVNKSFVEELPGIFIYTPMDTPLLTRKMEQNFNRKLIVNVEVVVDEKDEDVVPEDLADIIAGEIEDILLPNIFLEDPPPQDWPNPLPPGEPIVNYIQLTDTNMSKADTIKEDAYGIIMEFTCEYYYCRATQAYEKDLNRFGHTYNTGDMTAPNLTEIPPP